MDYRLQSPYCSSFKVPIQQKGLIMQHLLVRKLTRRELEDKYLRLIDENYDLKRENNVQKEKIKILTTKLLRLTKENSRYKSREFLFMDENNEILEAEEFFRGRGNRPASSSAIPRKSMDENLRNSTPNLSKFKSEMSLQETMSGKSTENSGVKNPDSNKIRDMQDEIERLTEEFNKLQELSDLEKETNAQLEIQITELKDKLNGKKMQMELETSVEIAELNKKIKELQVELREMETRYKKKLDENTAENEKLAEALEKERNKFKRYEAQSHDLEASQKMIEELMEQISSLEKEKAEIAMQYEKYATIADEVVNYKKRMSEMADTLNERERELEKEREDRASIEHSQEELLRKMKDLQKENDELVVKLEGLKSENDTLINKNKKLEDRMKNLESENIHQLQQINETLKLPTPIIRDTEAMMPSCAAEAQKIHDICEQVIRQRSLEMVSPEKSPTSSINSRRKSSTPSNLTIPPVIINDDKRPESPEKIIPKIIEPTTSEASKQTEEHYTSTINSQDVPTIPPDSPNKKGFAEMFSQSISKDEGEDEFDPKTFSIDQHKGSETIRQTKIETSIERAKNIILSDIFGTNKSTKLSTMKRVRLSVDTKMISPIYSPRISSLSNSSCQEHPKLKLNDYRPSQREIRIQSDNESLEEYIQRSNSSRNSTSSTSSQKIPQLVLDHIDDEKLLLKHSTHSIEIEIIKLELCENSALLDDDDANFLYVEYTFMNYKGYLLETQSLPKPKKSGDSIIYNMTRKFDINPQDKDFKHFKAMVDKKSNSPIKFLIVSEPIDAKEEDGGDCDEVGFACVKLNEVIEKSKSNTEKIVAECFSIAYPHELIAYLHIKITGIDILNKLSKLK
ncbi:flagellar attachment zone protein 1-like [Chironomus tepperi]|uniref:flagellar attachment zone protein 1-like n=1 Tax=Chironomus tepperi TaxID=113505 RepID=UPI00391F1CD7